MTINAFITRIQQEIDLDWTFKPYSNKYIALATPGKHAIEMTYYFNLNVYAENDAHDCKLVLLYDRRPDDKSGNYTFDSMIKEVKEFITTHVS